jgi:hypothetical protein
MAVVTAERAFLLETIHPGMNVYDNRRLKIGTASKVYSPYTDEKDFYIKVHSGFLALGHDLYIPSRNLAVWKDTENHAQVVVGVERQQLNKMGWEQRLAVIHEA